MQYPPDGATSSDDVRRTRNRAALAATSAAVVCLTAFGYLRGATGWAAFGTLCVFTTALVAFLVLAGVATAAVLDTSDVRRQRRTR